MSALMDSVYELRIAQLTAENVRLQKEVETYRDERDGAMKHLREAKVAISKLRNCGSACLTCKWSIRTNCPKYNEAGKIAGQTYFNFDESDKRIERCVRDAVISYNESFADCPNDDCEEELRQRAKSANEWLVAHGYEPEPFHYFDTRKKEV